MGSYREVKYVQNHYSYIRFSVEAFIGINASVQGAFTTLAFVSLAVVFDP